MKAIRLFSRFLIIPICLSLTASFGYPQVKVVRLPSGTPILLRTYDTITSEEATVNQVVTLKVIRDVTVDEAVVIKTGTDAYGKIAKCKKRKGWGRKGELEMRVTSVTAVDGTEVLLSCVQKTDAEGRTGTATAVGVGAGVLCLPFALTGFLIKGKEGEIPGGMEIKAYVDGNYKIKL